jgi:hypothetical protein
MGRKAEAIDSITGDKVLPHVEQRQAAVSMLVAMKASLRQIASALQKQGIVNPQTNEPYSYETIRKDIKQLRAEWARRTAQTTDEWIAEEIASLDELERAAWARLEFGTVLGCKKQRAALLGINAPVKVEYAMPPELVALLKEKNVKPSDVWATMMRKLSNADR